MNFVVVLTAYIALVFIISFFIKENYGRVWMFIVSLLLGIISYNARPVPGIFFDTERFDTYLDMLRQLNFQFGDRNGLHLLLTQTPIINGIGNFGNYDLAMYAKQPFIEIVAWLFSLLPNDGNLRLVVITVFCVVIFQVIRQGIYIIMPNHRKTYSWRMTFQVFCIFLGLFNIFYEIQGLRNFLAFALIALVVGGHYLRGTFNAKSVVLMIVAMLIHPAAILLVAIYLFFIILPKRTYPVLVFLSLSYQAFISPLSNLLEFLSKYIPALSGMSAYLSGSQNYFAGAAKIEIGLTTLLLIFVTGWLYSVTKKYSNVLPREYVRITWLFFTFTFGSFLNAQLYLRMIQFDTIMMLPLLLFVLIYSKIVFSSRQSLISTVWIHSGSFVMFVVWSMLTYRYVLVF